jgi:hypothetical protein
MAELLGHPEKVAQMGQAAFSWVSENMTWDIFADTLEKYLAENSTCR